MSTRSRRGKWLREPDDLEMRVFLLMVGFIFFTAAILGGIHLQDEFSWVVALVVAALGLVGAFFWITAAFGSRARIDKMANGVGSHEGALVLFVIAIAFVWLIKAVLPRGAK